MGLFSRGMDAVGVDIGSHNIKIVQLKKVGDEKYQLVKYGSAPVSLEYSLELSPFDRKQLAVTSLKKLLIQNKISTKNAVTSVSGNSVIVRYVKFPSLSHSELEKTIQFEAEPYIPFGVQDVNIGFQILGEVTDEGQKKMETILIAAKKEIIQDRIDILQEAGLRPVVVDVDAFALENAFELGSVTQGAGENVMLVDIGAMVTNIVIVENGVCRVVRDVLVGGDNFTKALQKNLQVDYSTGEKMKWENGLVMFDEKNMEKPAEEDEDSEDKAQISGIIANAVKSLIEEIQRSIDYYQTQSEEKIVSRIVLSGGSAKLNNLDKFMSQELHIPVEIHNPFRGEKVSTDLFSGEELVEESPSLVVAFGLALRREKDIK